MNPIVEDRLIKLHLNEIQMDVNKISLGERVVEGKGHSGWFSSRLLILGQWLIRLGEKMDRQKQRNEARHLPAACNYAQ